MFSYKVYHHNFTEKPDLILYSESPLSFGYAGYKLAKKLSIPVIYDQMDLWRNLSLILFPKCKVFNIAFIQCSGIERKFILT